MPQRIVLSKKKVSLNDDMREILRILEEEIKRVNLYP